MHKNSGFTLLELSIVLVIIGLIIGGITVGQDLIRSAELQQVTTDVNKYKVALNTFKLKYDDLPGDMSDAQSYWTSCIDNSGNTCNGNGSGTITTAYERWRFWQHLNLSDIVPGNFDGGQVGTSTQATRQPTTAIGEYWGVNYTNTFPKSGSKYKHYLSVQVDDDPLTTAEAYQLDTKTDDGGPATGSIFIAGADEGPSTCAAVNYNSSSPSQSTYVLAEGTSFVDCGAIEFALE